MVLHGGADSSTIQTGYTLRDICERISCGVATGADTVFVRKKERLNSELEIVRLSNSVRARIIFRGLENRYRTFHADSIRPRRLAFETRRTRFFLIISRNLRIVKSWRSELALLGVRLGMLFTRIHRLTLF